MLRSPLGKCTLQILETGTRIAHFNLFPPINTVYYTEHPRKRKNSKLIPTTEERRADAVFLQSNVFLIICCLFSLLFLMLLILNLYSCIRAPNHFALVCVLLCLSVVQCISPPVLFICSLYFLHTTNALTQSTSFLLCLLSFRSSFPFSVIIFCSSNDL